MTVHTTRLLGLLAVALALTAGTQAGPYDASDPYWRNRSENERGGFRYDDSGDVPWREDSGPVQIPPPPQDGALGELRLDSLPRSFTAYLDTKTLAVSPADGVLRYWLVVRSGGSSTISYEGMNCRGREYKVYGFADEREPEGVRRVPEPRWQALGLSRRGDFRWELADSYLCVGIDAKSPRDVIGSVRGHYDRATPFAEYRDNARPFVP